MYQTDFENDPAAFLERCGDFLALHKPEHSLIYAVCQHAARQVARGEKSSARLATLSDDEGVVAAAVQNPPYNLILSRSRGDISPLVTALAEQKYFFRAVTGPSDATSAFAAQWTEATGEKFVDYMDQIIYCIKKVLFPPATEGELRMARLSETPLIAQWVREFGETALLKSEWLNEKEAEIFAEQRIAAGNIYVWSVNGKPVAQAAIVGTDEAARISMVYTPEEHRGHGYASAAVAHASQHALDLGKKMVCLYADARNPVSNSIYRKIGYEFVGRSSLYVVGK